MASAVGIGLLCASAATPAQAVMPQSLSQEQKGLIDKIEAKLSDVSSLSATFEQVSSNGGHASGTVAILRPGKMRLEYKPPTQVQIIANGSHLIYIDKELDQVSFIDLNSTPAGILLRDKVSFNDPDLEVTSFTETPAEVEIGVIMAQDPGAGSLTLIFDRTSLNLEKWRMRDAQGVETTVVLQNVDLGKELDPEMFHYVQKQRPITQN